MRGGTPLRKPFVLRDDKFIPLESILLEYDGITAEQIDAMMIDEVEEAGEDDLGTLYDVSYDGRTILGIVNTDMGWITYVISLDGEAM